MEIEILLLSSWSWARMGAVTQKYYVRHDFEFHKYIWSTSDHRSPHSSMSCIWLTSSWSHTQDIEEKWEENQDSESLVLSECCDDIESRYWEKFQYDVEQNRGMEMEKRITIWKKTQLSDIQVVLKPTQELVLWFMASAWISIKQKF